jgi:peptide/nickel transport system ATP-binding protein
VAEAGVLLEVADLAIEVPGGDGPTRAVDGASFELGAGEVLALVGASGSGKSLTALSLLGLVDPPARVCGGAVRYRGRDLLALGERELEEVRGGRIALVFQEPATALNPVLTIGEQVAEVVQRHAGATAAEAWRRAEELLARVGLAEPGRVAREFPHRLSGGMRQRAMIAAALAGGPEILVADEPTTALDATVQAGILELLGELVRADGLALLLISHDLGVVAGVADRVAVMDAGRVVECAPVAEVFASPRAPATRALLEAVGERPADAPVEGPPSRVVDGPPARVADGALLEVDGLVVEYELGRGWRHRAGRGAAARARAVDGVSFHIDRGEALGLVGESGCGKSSVGRALLRLVPASARALRLTLGERRLDLLELRGRELARERRHVQIVFQDPYGSLNPSHTVRRIVGEGPRWHGLASGAALERRVRAALERVGLTGSALDRRPSEFSGGERQRIALARALAMEPSLVVLDEATSSLDAAVRVEVVELLAELRRDLGLSYLWISHDLSSLRRLCDRVAVMYLGQIVEQGATEELFTAPAHPYTRALIEAEPQPDPALGWRPHPLPGEPPSLTSPPAGCRFHPRCPVAEERCGREAPRRALLGDRPAGHWATCHLLEGQSSADSGEIESR